MNQALLVQYTGNLHPLSLINNLAKDFVTEDFILTDDFKNLDVLSFRMAALSKTTAGTGTPVYTIYAGGDCAFIVSLKETSPLAAEFDSSDPGSANRDKEIFTRAILIKELGLNAAEQPDSLIYTSDLPAALKAVDDGRYPYLFIFNF